MRLALRRSEGLTTGAGCPAWWREGPAMGILGRGAELARVEDLDQLPRIGLGSMIRPRLGAATPSENERCFPPPRSQYLLPIYDMLPRPEAP